MTPNPEVLLSRYQNPVEQEQNEEQETTSSSKNTLYAKVRRLLAVGGLVTASVLAGTNIVSSEQESIFSVQAVEAQESPEIQGSNNFDNAKIVTAGLAEKGLSFPTGWSQPGECMVSAQRWANAANGGKNIWNFSGSGVISIYTHSGGAEVGLDKLRPGDILQKASAAGDSDTNWDHVHTVVFRGYGTNGTVNIVDSNRYLDGTVRVTDNYALTAQTGWRWRAFRMGKVSSPSQSTPPESKKPIPGDYNGDKITDAAVYRPGDGYWHVRGVGDYQWGGWPGDIPVPADYNGDKKTDIAIYRPQNGGWYIRGVGVFSFGWNGDIPVPGDYNGDGDAEIAVYRPSTGNWHIREVGDFQWGRPGDIPVAGYYNNDDKLDIAIYRPENGGWYIRNIADIPYGWSSDIPVPADYTGDGVTDLAIYRPVDGGWRVRGLGDFPHGWSTDVPVPGRYNSDATADAAIYRPDDGGWRIRAVGDFPYGWSTDIPAIQTLNAGLLKRYGLLPSY